MTNPDSPDPVGVTRASQEAFEQRIRKLEQGLDAVAQRGATRLGRTTVQDYDGNNVLYVGPDLEGDVRPDGSPQWQTIIRRDGNKLVLYVEGTSSTDDGAYRQFWGLTDDGGNLVVSDDAYTGVGLARPWISIPMYPKANMPSGISSYLIVPVASVNTEQTIWEGRIPFVSHPFVQIDGVWGVASGTAGDPVYRLKINGTTVQTFTHSGLIAAKEATARVTAYYQSQFARIELTVQASGSVANIACQVLGLSLRQS